MKVRRIKALFMSIAVMIFAVSGVYSSYAQSDIQKNDGYQKALSFGHSYASAIKDDNTLITWGRNEEGVLGIGKADSYSTITQYSVVVKSKINAPKKIAENIITADFGINNHAAYINENGELYLWGRNTENQLGFGDALNKYSPVKIMDNVKSVSLGNRISAAVKQNGELYVWGCELCRNERGGISNSSTLQKVMENVKDVSMCGSSIAVITDDDCLYAWGENEFGEVGNATITPVTSPVKIMENVRQVCMGGTRCAAVTKDNTLYMWGEKDRKSVV